MSSLRVLNRSATKPTTGMSSSDGPNWRAITMPTAEALLSVRSLMTIQSWAVRCSHVPMLDTRAPANQIR